jgi:hypothetical protein
VLDVHDVDEVIHRYHKATQDLWKFCYLGGSGAGAESVAATLEHLTAEDRRLFNVLRRRPPRPHLRERFADRRSSKRSAQYGLVEFLGHDLTSASLWSRRRSVAARPGEPVAPLRTVNAR